MFADAVGYIFELRLVVPDLVEEVNPDGGDGVLVHAVDHAGYGVAGLVAEIDG